MARKPDVAFLMTAFGSLDISLTSLLWINFFCNFPSTRLQSHQQHHAAPEVALTVRSMLLTPSVLNDAYMRHTFKCTRCVC